MKNSLYYYLNMFPVYQNAYSLHRNNRKALEKCYEPCKFHLFLYKLNQITICHLGTIHYLSGGGGWCFYAWTKYFNISKRAGQTFLERSKERDKKFQHDQNGVFQVELQYFRGGTNSFGPIERAGQKILANTNFGPDYS